MATNIPNIPRRAGMTYDTTAYFASKDIMYKFMGYTVVDKVATLDREEETALILKGYELSDSINAIVPKKRQVMKTYILWKKE